MRHEIGHTFGMDHVDAPGAVMSKGAPLHGIWTGRSFLDADDAELRRAADYAPPPPSCATLRRHGVGREPVLAVPISTADLVLVPEADALELRPVDLDTGALGPSTSEVPMTDATSFAVHPTDGGALAVWYARGQVHVARVDGASLTLDARPPIPLPGAVSPFSRVETVLVPPHLYVVHNHLDGFSEVSRLNLETGAATHLGALEDAVLAPFAVGEALLAVAVTGDTDEIEVLRLDAAGDRLRILERASTGTLGLRDPLRLGRAPQHVAVTPSGVFLALDRFPETTHLTRVEVGARLFVTEGPALPAGTFEIGGLAFAVDRGQVYLAVAARTSSLLGRELHVAPLDGPWTRLSAPDNTSAARPQLIVRGDRSFATWTDEVANGPRDRRGRCHRL